MKSIALLTSGGDGRVSMRVFERSPARRLKRGVEVYGVRWGYRGWSMAISRSSPARCRRHYGAGGDCLGIARCPEFKDLKCAARRSEISTSGDRGAHCPSEATVP